MKKKILLVLIIIIALFSAGLIYLNNVILPTRIKSLIIEGLKERTQKKVTLESLEFSLFKGLVLKDLKVYDGKNTLLSLKEGSCIFLIPPLFKKAIIIPSLKLKSPEIFLERRQDNTFNLQDLFLGKPAQSRTKFSVYVWRVSVRNANIHFQDDTLTPSFTKEIKNLNLNLYLSLPASIKFNLKAEIPAPTSININAAGEFLLPDKQMLAKISVQDFSPKEFFSYYQNLGISIPEGLIGATMELDFKDNTLYINGAAQNKNLAISQRKILARLNSDITANLKYNLLDRQLKVSGKAVITDSKLIGLEFVDVVDNINGEVSFNNSGVSSDKLNANIWGLPVKLRVELTNFNKPLLNLNVASALNLASVSGILKDKFKFVFPGDIKGEGNLSLNIQTRIPSEEALQINGYIDVSNAILKLEKINYPFQDIFGRLQFNQNQLQWTDMNFKYLDTDYKTTGLLIDFKSPAVMLALSSKELSLESSFTVDNKLIKVDKLSGLYLNSKFSLTGKINAINHANLESEIKGELSIDLRDAKEPLKRFKNQLEQIKPEGIVNVQVSVNGNISDFKSCTVTANLAGSSVSFFGLKAKELLLSYAQINGIADIPLMHLSLYDGTIEGNAKMNLNSDNSPYWIIVDIQGVKIEELKLDTTAKDKDIAGTIAAQVKINGFSNDISKLSGTGNVSITDGKLWQLNLFKGLGSLLFARDYANIVFHEGSCGFSIQDKYIFTDNLKLKSDIANLSGSVKIGFDNSIDAALSVEISSEAAPLTGTFKDVTTAIISQGGKFGVIKIGGTLKDPKYKFQPAVADIIRGLKETFFGK